MKDYGVTVTKDAQRLDASDILPSVLELGF